MSEGEIRRRADDARKRFARARDLYYAMPAGDNHQRDAINFDRGYWLGKAHGLEEANDVNEKDND